MNNNDELCYSWYITALICDSMMVTLRLCLGASVSVLVMVLVLVLRADVLLHNTAVMFSLSNQKRVVSRSKPVSYSECCFRQVLLWVGVNLAAWEHDQNDTNIVMRQTHTQYNIDVPGT